MKTRTDFLLDESGEENYLTILKKEFVLGKVFRS